MHMEVEEDGGRLLEGDIFLGTYGTSLVPRPHPLTRKESGDFLGCAVNSIETNAMPCKLASEIGLHQKYAIIDCSTIDTANLAQP